MIVDEPIHAVSSEVILSTQRTTLVEGHLIPERRLKITTDDQNHTLRITREQLFHFQAIPIVQRVVTIAKILIQFSIPADLRTDRRNDQTVARIVMKCRTVP